ncbi:MAG: DEAD/DEAH box helicase [Chitinophagaceae bacterium]
MEQLVKTPLWPHQLELSDRFERIPRVGAGWWMGTGKTLYAIERDLRFRAMYDSKHSYKTLVVAPSGVHPNWIEALKHETGSERILRMNPKDRNAFYKHGYDYYVMHWEALRFLVDRFGKAKTVRPIEVIRDLGFTHVIMDEAHRLKNRKSQRTVAAKHLEIRLATDLTGSPIPNKPQDIWSLLNHLYPRSFKSFWPFVRRYIEIDESGPYLQLGAPTDLWYKEREDLLGNFFSIIDDTMVPSLKLPEMIHTTLECELGAKQRSAYNAMEQDMLAWVDSHDGEDSPLAVNAVIAQLIRLQQFAIGYMSEVEPGKYRMTQPAAKLELIKDYLEDFDEQFVLFSQFSQPLDLLKQMMPDDVTLYTGSVPNRIREGNLERFKNGFEKVIAMTYGTGGEGIDGMQHTCRNVILLDKAWSPSVNDQAIARIRRAGQKYPVNVIDIEAVNTIDRTRNIDIAYKGKINRKMLGLS